MAEVWGEPFARMGEAFNRVEGTLSEGQPPGEMGVGGQGRGEPVPQPSDFGFGRKVQVVKPDACGGRGGAFLRCAPVDKLGFWDREGQSFRSRDAAPGPIMTLEELDVPSVRGGRHCDHDVVNVAENQALGDVVMERGDVNNKQEGGDRGALRGTHSDG